jgi:hypothetical protein
MASGLRTVLMGPTPSRSVGLYWAAALTLLFCCNLLSYLSYNKSAALYNKVVGDSARVPGPSWGTRPQRSLVAREEKATPTTKSLTAVMNRGQIPAVLQAEGLTVGAELGVQVGQVGSNSWNQSVRVLNPTALQSYALVAICCEAEPFIAAWPSMH